MGRNNWSKEYMAEYCRNLYVTQRNWFFELLGGKCVKCGANSNFVIDHIDPSLKSCDVGGYFGKGKLPAILEELKKCQLLCSDCNLIKTKQDLRTIGYKQGLTHGTVYAWMKVKCKCVTCNDARYLWHDKRNAKRRVGPGYKTRARGGTHTL